MPRNELIAAISFFVFIVLVLLVSALFAVMAGITDELTAERLSKFQALIGNLIGFGGLITAAYIGFKGVETQTRANARQARVQIRSSARFARIHENGRLAAEARALAEALAAELHVAHTRLHVLMNRVNNERRIIPARDILIAIKLPQLRIVNANLANIGKLEIDPKSGVSKVTNLAGSVATVISTMDEAAEFIAYITRTQAYHLANNNVHALNDAFRDIIQHLELSRRHVEATAARLDQFARGEIPLFETVERPARDWVPQRWNA